MNYIEFDERYTKLDSKEFPLVNAYKDNEGNVLVVEPSFYFGLENIKLRRENAIPLIMDKIDQLLKTNKQVILTADFESPFFERESFIYKELGDILDSLNIFFEDKSRGSDYGD